MNSVSFEFDRDRFADMAGNYNAVFTADVNNPAPATSRYLHMTVTSTRKLSGYLKDTVGVKDNFAAGLVFDANGHIVITTLSGVTITGDLAWTGSEDTNGVKQFIGSASIATSNVMFVADQENKYALATAGFATMQIPGVNNNPGGTGIAMFKLKNGSIGANYILGDNDKQTVAWPMLGSRSGNVPQWIVTKTGVLFGNLVAADGLTTLSAPSLSWIRNATFPGYPTLNSVFVNSPFAGICSPYDGTAA